MDPGRPGGFHGGTGTTGDGKRVASLAKMVLVMLVEAC